MEPAAGAQVDCPSCGARVPYAVLNRHLDGCLAEGEGEGEGEGKSAHPAPARPAPPHPPPPHPSPPPAKKLRPADPRPFAERMRPTSLDEFVGQRDVVHALGGLLARGTVPSMVLWGPPGTGKTTLARLLTRTAGGTPPYRFVEFSATTASIVDVKRVIDDAQNRLALGVARTVLFIDEIQRFSRAQQDIFLPAIERGTIALVAATTENPSFRLQSALLSRLRCVVLHRLSTDETCEVLRRGAARADAPAWITPDVLRWIANASDGDARTALGALEVALTAGEPAASTEHNMARLAPALRRSFLQYDRAGDAHYDTISALHKSIRGSDADAALYWLARMVAAGDDPLFIARRLIVCASEDCCSADALQLAVATYRACEIVGLPECGINLSHCTLVLAEHPKSTRSYRAWKRALATVDDAPNFPVPLHIRNAPTRLMRDIGYGKEYRYEPSYAHPVFQEFFPPEMRGTRFVSPPPPDTTTTDAPSPPAPPMLDGPAGSGPGACARIHAPGARAVDLALLAEWEQRRNHGRPWPGRASLE